jgi:hypothetical protein
MNIWLLVKLLGEYAALSTMIISYQVADAKTKGKEIDSLKIARNTTIVFLIITGSFFFFYWLIFMQQTS